MKLFLYVCEVRKEIELLDGYYVFIVFMFRLLVIVMYHIPEVNVKGIIEGMQCHTQFYLDKTTG